MLAVSLSFLAVVGCGSSKPIPEVASSAGDPGYCVVYPSELAQLVERYEARSGEAREKVGTFEDGIDDLKEPVWRDVLTVVEKADEAGRSRSYSRSVEEKARVRAFFDEEREEITRRVGGAVKTSLKKAECDCEVETYGRINFALKESVNRQLGRRIERRSEAHRFIERNRGTLGKKNVDRLGEQADLITETSHIVFVELPILWNEIVEREGEARRVKRTLEDSIEAEQELMERPEVAKAERKDAEARVADLEEAKGRIDEVAASASSVVASGEEDIVTIRVEYEDAFDALCTALSD